MEKPSEIILNKFLENRCTQVEHETVLNYLNSLELEELNQFMDSHLNKIENEEIALNKNINLSFNKVISKLKAGQSYKKYSRRRFIYSIAASVAFLLILASGVFYYFNLIKDHPNELNWTEKITRSGEKSELTLSDGTKITLNAESKLNYPIKFKNKIREVFLEGEAYFEVKHDANHPFIVHTGNLSVKVLGTKFNVNAFPNENSIKVSLIEGKVNVSKVEEGKIDEIGILKPKEQLLYNKENKSRTFDSFDPETVIGWKHNLFQFNDEPLGEVLLSLERSYGIKFELTDKSMSNLKITATFKDNSIQTISEVINKLTGIKYRAINENNKTKKVIFYR